MSIKIPISGMHCRSCEILIEDNLKKITGVDKVNVSHKIGQAEIFYHGGAPSQNDIKSAVVAAGYTVGIKGKLPWVSKEASDYRNLLLAATILFVLYGLASWFGLFELNINTTSTSLGVVLLVGLVAGVSTCMALVGGLVLSLSARHAELHPEATPLQKFRPHLYFNLGRIVGYAILGGLIGLVGSAFKFSAGLLGFMTIIVGLVMLFLGLKLIEIFPALKEKTIALPKFISRLFGITNEQKEYSHKSAMITGALTFFLPCGFTQAMQLLAVSSGSFGTGAMIMGLFALGTAPGLLGVGGLASVFKGKKARVFFVVAGLLVILLGGYNIVNGSRLLSTISLNNNGKNQTVVNSGEFQEVRMTQGSNGYSPNVFTVEKGKTVRWIINSESVYSCASYIMMPKFKISKALTRGENIITFTPTETGEIPFSCSMGMYRGKFIVVDGPVTSANNINTENNSLATGGVCGLNGCSAN
ncbi:MAG: hypothetical protein US58_C0007G0011 [Candidatus Magasanikbacteria bacterium GW2011_GWA2_37_8]|uniref:HMA domain-containing protein n=1 Tax=Candidatus Magasanikbacteria bacterium GW2011_GWA2_37_8 TaxID=1619036 RepID=A0A0G0HQV1_9BACT|nr:MAG: hypothetical protein US58_C0007G0011 [Candidatus Magasanikbacteria bacterium GW2011_GWA2_37_8]